LTAHFTKRIGHSALQKLFCGAVLDLEDCARIVDRFANECTADRVARCEQAFQARGDGAGQVPRELGAAQIIRYVFERDASLAQIKLLSYAPARNANELLDAVVARTLSQSDVQRIAAAPHVALNVCTANISQLRLITLDQVAQLDSAAEGVAGGGGVVNQAAIELMVGLLRNPVLDFDAGQILLYLKARVLYTNLTDDVIRSIIQYNGGDAAESLRAFNAKLA